MANQATYIIKLTDLFTSVANRVARSTLSMTRNFGIAGKALKKLGYHFTSLRNIISATYGAAMIAFPIKKAMEFESIMIDVQRVMEFLPGGFEEFRDRIEEISKHLGMLPTKVGEIAYAGAKLTNTAEDLDKFVSIASNAAYAFDMAGTEAGNMLGNIKAKLGYTIKETENFLDAVNYLADNMETTGQRSLQTTSRMLAEIKQYNLPPQLVAGWAAFADSVSTTPRLAASGMRLTMRELSKSRRWGSKMIKDAHGTMTAMLQKYADMPLRRRLRLINRRFSKAAGEFVKLASASMSQYNKAFGLVQGNKYVGSMMVEVEKKLKSARTAVDQLAVAWFYISKAIGDTFLPIIKAVAPELIKISFSIRDFVKEHPQLTKIVFAFIAIATALSAVTIVIGLVSVALGTLLSPAVLVIGAIIAIVAAFAYFYNKSERIRKILGELASTLAPVKNAFISLFNYLMGSDVKGIADFFELFIYTFLYDMNSIIGTVIGSFKTLYEWGEKFINVFTSAPDWIAEVGKNFSNFMTDRINNSVSAAFNANVKNTVNGRITVAAEKGTKVKSANTFNLGAAKFGMYMED